MTVETKKLEETKGSFTLKGIIRGLNNERAVREGVTSSDKDYKALSFDVETSPSNRVRVEMFGMEREVIFYNAKSKQSKRVPFDNRNKTNLKGFRLMGVNINASGDKTDRKTLIEYDAVDYITENFNDGDAIYVRGQLDFSEFENAHGEKVNKTGFRIQSIAKIKEGIDFNEEDFQPHAFFKQDIVVTELMKEDDRLNIIAKIIKYNGDLADASFVVDSSRLKKFSKTLEKNLKFGDFITVKGWVVSETLEEVEESESLDDDWGGETPEGMDENYITTYINELQIVNVDKESHEPQKYTEEDLFSQEEEDYGDDDVSDDDDDFDEDDGDGELPFAD